MSVSYWDYIIIGAGISGAVVLEQLVEKYGNTKNILILERDQDIGGAINSYQHNYGDSKFKNSNNRRIIELGGMRYFKEIMPNVEKYRKKYKLTRKQIIVHNKNILLENNEIKNIADEKYFDGITNTCQQIYIRKFISKKKDTLTSLITNFDKRKKIFNDDKLCSLNLKSYFKLNNIDTTDFVKITENGGYNGFLNSDIAAAVTTFSTLDISGPVQDIIVEGFQNMVKKILISNGLNTIDNKTKKVTTIKLSTNVYKAEGNKLLTNNGIFIVTNLFGLYLLIS